MHDVLFLLLVFIYSICRGGMAAEKDIDDELFGVVAEVVFEEAFN